MIQFRSRDGQQVDVESVGEGGEIDQDVGQLLPNPRMQWLGRRSLPRLVRRQPLEEFGEFADLTDQGEEHRLRVVELAPAPLPREGAHLVLESG